MKQKQRVLRLLTDAEWNNDGVCKGRFYRLDSPITQPGARIFELQADGYNIESVACNQHTHSDGMKMYRLVTDAQMKLGGT